MAWLQTAPDFGDKTKHPPRFKTLPKNSDYLIMPDADKFIVDCWENLGRCETDGMGARQLKWSEIDAFCNRSGHDLEPWQCQSIIDMSKSYCSFISSEEIKSPQCPAPKLELLSEEERLYIQRKEVAEQLRAKRRKKPA